MSANGKRITVVAIRREDGAVTESVVIRMTTAEGNELCTAIKNQCEEARVRRKQVSRAARGLPSEVPTGGNPAESRKG